MTRASKPRNNESASPWRGVAIIAGLVVACIAFLTIEPAIETAAIVAHREHYRAVEFEIENVMRAKHGPNLTGRILPDGAAAEAYASEFAEVWTGTARSTVRQIRPAEELRALRLTAWHNPGIPRWLDEVRILSRSRRSVLPTLTDAVHSGLVPLIALVLAVALVTWGAWRPRTKRKSRDVR